MFISLPNQSYPTTSEISYIRIDDHDTWSMDATLAQIIAPMLRKLRADKVGIPAELAPENQFSQQMCFDFIDHNREYDIAEQQWDDILAKMVSSFESIENGSYDEEAMAGIKLFAHYYGSLWS